MVMHHVVLVYAAGVAVNRGITLVTALSGATALVQSLSAARHHASEVYALQDLSTLAG
jgi:hypothetical protein